MVSVGGEDPIRAEPAQVKSRMLKPVSLSEIWRYQYLIIEPVDRAIEMRLVIANLDLRDTENWP